MARHRVVAVLMSLSLLYLVTASYGLTPEEEEKMAIAFIEDRIQQVATSINGWKWERNITLTLAIFVAILGAITGILQKSDTR